MAGGGPGSHGSTKQNYDLDQIWGDLREGIEHVSMPRCNCLNMVLKSYKTILLDIHE